ncbi:MAG: MATE family efflux transporter, partial [Anaerolineae bacterium]|nr:MATE family efflux transporter [Anaerolineae bacterium]
MTNITTSIQDHPFVKRPNRTLLALSIPVLFSLIAEPLTGLVDTAFVARLGAEALAALGVGTAALSSVFWVFNFLGIGTQTSVAQALGKDDNEKAARITGLALVLSGVFGVALFVIGWLAAEPVAGLLGATGEVQTHAVEYMRFRLFGAPAVLAMLTAFGALRGVQDMRTPLWIALVVNAINMVLDALIIVGYGPIPAWGIAGAAIATVLAQWAGALWAVTAVLHKLGRPATLYLHEAKDLLQIGGNLFLRTGLLTIFLLLTTRVATQIGVQSGAAHQAIRQFWLFAALGLDALAITAQSLVGYFIGSDWVVQAKRVAKYACVWGIGLGVVLALGMWLGMDWIGRLLVPETAVSIFTAAWLMSAFVQPVNSLAFVTDGVHWGTGDFAYLRNGMFIATAVGSLGLLLIDQSAEAALTWVWG